LVQFIEGKWLKTLFSALLPLSKGSF